MLKPLIKYTGGKYKEYKYIKDIIPETIANYYEPFFGGGGIFFQLHNDGRIKGDSIINDLSKPLMEFYECLREPKFVDEIYKISNAWEFIKRFGDAFYNKYGVIFEYLMFSKRISKFVTGQIMGYISSYLDGYYFNTHGFSLVQRIADSIDDKLKKFVNKDIGEDERDVCYQCITTSICQAFYFIIRDMYNDWNNGGNFEAYTKEERCAQWLFIREFCYGSMFRFSSNGNFNIPYGGFSYNSKCFTCKLEMIVSDETVDAFKKTSIHCEDFETLISNSEFGENDFMFLDPPYDSTFSEYDGNSFTREDHKRLHDCLGKCKCKWLMIIGKTDFIDDLYKDYSVLSYDKIYAYSARGRKYDNKKTKHLIVTNYQIDVKTE